MYPLGVGEHMGAANKIPVLVYGAEAAAIEDFLILFGMDRAEPGIFDGLGPAFEAELYRSIYADADFPAVELTAVSNGRAAAEAVGYAVGRGRPFQIAFIDLGAPPSNWGLDVAAAVRKLDPYLHLVLIATRCDLSAAAISARIPPADRLCLLGRPFQPLEIEHQILAAQARGRADQLERLSGARAGSSGPGYRMPLAARPELSVELAEVLVQLRTALGTLLDEPRTHVGADYGQQGQGVPTPAPSTAGWPAHGLAETSPRYEAGEAKTGASLGPSGVSGGKARHEEGGEPEKTADA